MENGWIVVSAKLEDILNNEDLFIGSSVCRVWWQIVHQEAYKRWKKYACKIGDIYKEIQAIREQEQNEEIEWQEASYAVEELNNCMDVFTGNQVYIMNKMLKYEMIVDL
ncbi:hypothetical protein C1646_671740 [Rhizophagus diaphanus]|nr:hypothetical protein C1646_671740 [Rhizophagus diaphanus] [Rhizophagus sp. MUCL 43196]